MKRWIDGESGNVVLSQIHEGETEVLVTDGLLITASSARLELGMDEAEQRIVWSRLVLDLDRSQVFRMNKQLANPDLSVERLALVDPNRPMRIVFRAHDDLLQAANADLAAGVAVDRIAIGRDGSGFPGFFCLDNFDVEQIGERVT